MNRGEGIAAMGSLAMNWMILPLKRYADFSGRSRRQEYWMFILGQIVVFAVLVLLYLMLLPTGVPVGGVTGLSTGPSGGMLALIGLGAIFVLAVFIPTLAVQVRRFHDQDKSGWFVLLQFIPYVGGIIMLVFMCIEGTRGANRFGSDPVPEHLHDTFA